VIPTSGATPVGGGVGELAFASTREGVSQIFLVNFDGSDPTRLTTLTDGACQPAWSPDGVRLAFTSPCNANREVYPGAQIFIMNADGSNLEPLPSVPGGDFDPAWSSDGKRIAFTSLRDRHAQIYVIDVESKVISNLSSNPAAEMQPAWSPTGAELLFTGERTDSLDIWIMPEQGGSSKRFTRGGEDTHPDWGSTGSLIIFTQRIDGVSRLVATTYESDGLIGNRVCPSGEQAGYPMAEARLSPDQSWIAFETWPSGSNHEIAVMSLNCTNFRYLTDDPGLDFDPAWRP
jgi:Tol biopolymer transport system component